MRGLWIILMALAGCVLPARRAPPPDLTPTPPPEAITPKWFGPEGGQPKAKSTSASSESPAVATGRVVPPPRWDRPQQNQRSPLGANLQAPGIRSRDWVFLDAFKMSSPWVSERRGRTDDRRLELDEWGWVRTLLPDKTASTQVPTHEGGAYVVLFEGRGIVEVSGARVEQERPGRLLVKAPRGKVMRLRLRTTNPTDYVRNIRVVPQGYEATHLEHVFHPKFLSRLAKFSVVRFAGWTHADQSGLRYWYQRTTFDYGRQTGPYGVAFEYMIMLANELRADLWVTIPYAANEELVTRLASLLFDNLETDRRVYIEYAHEPWRPGRPAYDYCRREGGTMGLSDNPKKAGLMYQAFRSRQIFKAFTSVFGGRERLVRVLSGPVGLTADLETLLSWEGIYQDVDRLAVAPYLDLSHGLEASGSGALQETMDALELGGLPKVMSKIRTAQRVAKSYDVSLISYEGGVHHPQGTAPERSTSMSRHYRMKDILTEMLEGWMNNGGELFVHAPLVGAFTDSQWSAALENQDQNIRSAPKYDALMSFIEDHPRWWILPRKSLPKSKR